MDSLWINRFYAGRRKRRERKSPLRVCILQHLPRGYARGQFRRWQQRPKAGRDQEAHISPDLPRCAFWGCSSRPERDILVIENIALVAQQQIPNICSLPVPRRSQGDDIKRTFQPKKKYRVKTHGFRIRMSTPGGRKVLKARRQKGRYELTPRLVR